MSLDEASRQLELAAHDARVAFDLIGLGEIDRAHVHAITARTAADAAETALRFALLDAESDGAEPDQDQWEQTQTDRDREQDGAEQTVQDR